MVEGRVPGSAPGGIPTFTRRIRGPRSDNQDVGETDDPGKALLGLYERALPAVYGYLVDRCGDRDLAEDLTSETFLAAVMALGRPEPPGPSIPWLVGVARHKLVDHWRRRGRDARLAEEVAAISEEFNDPWDVELDRLRSAHTLAVLGGHHRAVLTLRYVDALSVAEVAEAMDRSIEATESLLTRAKAAFRRAYGQGGDHG